MHQSPSFTLRSVLNIPLSRDLPQAHLSPLRELPLQIPGQIFPFGPCFSDCPKRDCDFQGT